MFFSLLGYTLRPGFGYPLDAWRAQQTFGLFEPLVNAQAPFGTFAVLPDHAALGAQAANLILDLAEDGWRTDEHPIDLPLSTLSVLDVQQARSRFGLRSDALDHIDRAVR